MTIPTANLVAYWKFDESSGDAADSSGNNLTLTNTSATYEAGKKNNCATLGTGATFQGADSDFYDFGTGVFTIAFWLKTSNTSRNGVVADNSAWTTDGCWGVQINSPANKLEFSSNDGYLDTSASVNDGDWHRIVFVREGTGTNQFKCYIDGDLDSTTTVAENFNASTGFWIGQGLGTGLSGSIDELKIWKGYAFTTGDVTEDFTGFSPIASNPDPSSVTVGTGKSGTRFLSSKYPVTIGLTAGTTKQTGNKEKLEYEQSFVSSKEKVGL